MKEIGPLQTIKLDLYAVIKNDPATRSLLVAALCSSGFHALVMYRFFHFLYLHGYFISARILSSITRFFTGIEIHPGARIGAGVFIDHGAGVVIGETAEVGKGTVIYQGVTLGGTGKDSGKRHPTVGCNTVLGCGAKILGPFTVGDGAKIGAGAVVLEEVPAGATVVGMPAEPVRIKGISLPSRLDELDARLSALENTVNNKQKQF